jgi:4-alpha-glucanotransferase
MESVIATLAALGAPVEGPEDLKSALRQRRQELARRFIEPVVVLWSGDSSLLEARLPQADADAVAEATIFLEGGGERSLSVPCGEALVLGVDEVEGVRYVRKALRLPADLPAGRHRLFLEAGRATARAFLLVAPVRAYDAWRGRRAWGVILPLYALHGARSWGAGDFADLRRLMGFVGERGGSVVGVLPLLAAFLDRPCEPSPYAPASRLFWNEAYAAVDEAPGLAACDGADEALGSAHAAAEIEALRASPLIDWRRLYGLKRVVLQRLADCFMSERGFETPAFRAFADRTPELESYARFRAVHERLGRPWRLWPSRLQAGDLRPTDFEERARAYHVYVQWLTDRQLAEAAAEGAKRGVCLYLDLPLGAHADGYDVWRHRELFAVGASAGAPPDPFFAGGQVWGFPPPRPEAMRAEGYAHLGDVLAHHLRYAGLLRVDHVLGLHRLFWVPAGAEPAQGVYVRYPAEEMYALLSIASHGHRAGIVGEDLGTVPAYVRPAMRRHGIGRSFVVQLEARPEAARTLPAPPPGSVASLNTHDLPPFASFWRGGDIDVLSSQGHVSRRAARAMRAERRRVRRGLRRQLGLGAASEAADGEREAFRASLDFLARSRAGLVLLNLEDAWAEEAAQNMPGTALESNWRRRARYEIEEVETLPEVGEAMGVLGRGRRRQRA